MPNRNIDFLAAIIVALTRTWDTKLPGFAAEFKSQVDALIVVTPVANLVLRDALGRLSDALE